MLDSLPTPGRPPAKDEHFSVLLTVAADTLHHRFLVQRARLVGHLLNRPHLPLLVVNTIPNARAVAYAKTAAVWSQDCPRSRRVRITDSLDTRMGDVYFQRLHRSRKQRHKEVHLRVGFGTGNKIDEHLSSDGDTGKTESSNSRLLCTGPRLLRNKSPFRGR